jgi:hypothetical protein
MILEIDESGRYDQSGHVDGRLSRLRTQIADTGDLPVADSNIADRSGSAGSVDNGSIHEENILGKTAKGGHQQHQAQEYESRHGEPRWEQHHPCDQDFFFTMMAVGIKIKTKAWPRGSTG